VTVAPGDAEVRPAERGGAVLELLRASGALLEGHFLLSSGLHSPRYVQCAKLLEHPSRARRVGAWLADLLRPLGVESVLSPALGGLIVGHEVEAALGVPFRFTERKDAMMELRRGFVLHPAERVAIVEDVVTTGKSTLETAEAAGALGAEMVAVGAILDRTGGRHSFPVPFASLLALDIPAWPAGQCPLCAAGGQAEKPGSRPG
jgi:orotate phosphoribosyltransferase